MPDLSPEALQQLRQQLDAALAAPPTAAQPPAAPQDFCSVWQSAKPILLALSGIAALIPGYGSTAAAALTALISVGDQIYKGTCHQ